MWTDTPFQPDPAHCFKLRPVSPIWHRPFLICMTQSRWGWGIRGDTGRDQRIRYQLLYKYPVPLQVSKYTIPRSRPWCGHPAHPSAGGDGVSHANISPLPRSSHIPYSTGFEVMRMAYISLRYTIRTCSKSVLDPTGPLNWQWPTPIDTSHTTIRVYI